MCFQRQGPHPHNRSFPDHIYETYDAPIGHNKDDVILPLSPVYTHQGMFKKSFQFGYDYDDVDENGKYRRRFCMTLLYFFL